MVISPYLERLITYKLYWISFSALIIIVSNLFWVRGSYGDFKSRLEIAKNRINKFSIIGISVSLILFIGFGSYIFYNTNILNEYHQPKYYEKLAQNMKKNIRSIKITSFQRSLP